jgi:Flp pilus assembly protein TadB
MTLNGLASNIEREKQILKEIFSLNEQMNLLNKKEDKDIVEKKINSSINQIKILNNSIPSILENISVFKEFPSSSKIKEKKSSDILNVSYASGDNKLYVQINKNDRDKFLNELRIEKVYIDRLKKKNIVIPKENSSDFKSPNFYKKISNRIFLNTSTSLLKKDSFKGLENSLRKASIPFLPNSYLSMTLFSTLLAFLVGIIVLIFIGVLYPTNLVKYLFIILLLPIITFFSFYFYPITESQGVGQKIRNELPFVTLHMAAISGSRIEPSQIFKIIAFGTEYPNTRKQFIKIINQTNLYGYDLVTSLKNVSKDSPSKELSELLGGIATTISSGGDITEFLNKRAETLFFEYRMDREKYTKEAETFMDIYISMVIAAPMILSLLLVLMNMGIMNIGIPMSLLNILMIGGIALINIVFIVFLNLKQVNY